MSITPITKPVEKLGEGPHWEESTQSLLYVDIFSGNVHRWNSINNEETMIHLDGTVGFVVPRKSGGYVVGLNRTFAHLDFTTHATSVIGRPVDEGVKSSINDGKCDAAGRIWAGTEDASKQDFYSDIASLYRLDTNGEITRQLDKITVSNGIAWSGDNRTMYYIDSFPRKVEAFDYDLQTGNISNRRVVVDFGDASTLATLGYPDGMTIDTEGKLWVACYGVGKVIRFDPQTGRELKTINFPVKNITSCCFGGTNFDELYVTSGRLEMTEEQLQESPLAGACFKVTGLGFRGTPAFEYEG